MGNWLNKLWYVIELRKEMRNFSVYCCKMNSRMYRSPPLPMVFPAVSDACGQPKSENINTYLKSFKTETMFT